MSSRRQVSMAEEVSCEGKAEDVCVFVLGFGAICAMPGGKPQERD